MTSNHVSNQANSNEISNRKTLIAMERATVAAFKSKSESEFTKNFSSAYVGIADDGFKTGADEVAGMNKLDLSELTIENENASFPADNVGIVTYVMNAKGSRGAQPIAGKIYTSTVYVRLDGEWRAMLHTESMSPN